MMGWKEFEMECYNYLCNRYGSDRVGFTKLGEENSTKPDILVSLSTEEEYYMETKEPKAQCGQFVLTPNDTVEEFEYSFRNKSGIDEYSKRIISYMNSMYGEFRNAGTRGKSINLDEIIFINWIINYYKEKGVKFFITKGEEGFIIFPIHKFGDYFEVTAKYRKKKSGSANPSKNNISDIKKVLVDNFVKEFVIEMVGKKIHIVTEADIDKMRGKVGNYEYYFRKIAEKQYIVTRLSNTRNSNVIFSIKLKKEQDLEDLKLFESSL